MNTCVITLNHLNVYDNTIEWRRISLSGLYVNFGKFVSHVFTILNIFVRLNMEYMMESIKHDNHIIYLFNYPKTPFKKALS